MAQSQDLVHLVAAQIKVAVAQSKVVIHPVALLVIDWERRGFGDVVDDDFVSIYFDLARRQVGVDRIILASLHFATKLDDGFWFQASYRRVEFIIIGIRIGLHLCQAFAVSHINKENPAVISDGVYPADQRYRFPNVARAKLATMMGSFHSFEKRLRTWTKLRIESKPIPLKGGIPLPTFKKCGGFQSRFCRFHKRLALISRSNPIGNRSLAQRQLTDNEGRCFLSGG